MTVQHTLSVREIAAACLLSAAGALVFNAFPLFLSTIAQQYSFGDEQLGLLGAYYLGAFSLVALFAPGWVSRLPWRITALVAYAIIIAALFLLRNAESENVHWGMAMLGLGSSFLFTIGLGVLSAAADPERTFGFKLSTEMTLAAIVMFSMTSLVVSRYGYSGFIWGTAVIYGATALSIIGLPANFLGHHEEEAAKPDIAVSSNKVPVVLASVALFLQFATFSGLWGFMERIGALREVGSEAIGAILTISVICGIGGAAVSVAIGNRFGQKVPIIVGLLLAIATVAILQFGQGVILFGIAACMVSALIQFLLAYQMGLVAELDDSGRFTVMIAFILAFSGALGPGVLGAIVERQGLEYGLALSAIAFILTMVVIVMATKAGFPTAAKPSEAVASE